MDTSQILTWNFAYEFLQGPMVWIAFAVFIFGTIYQVIRFSCLMQKKPARQLKPGPGNIIAAKASDTETCDWMMSVKLSVMGVNPFVTIISTIFHVLLVIMPFFVLGHNILWDNAFGISMVSLPEPTTDFLTLIVILCSGVFLYRRLFLYRVKIITTAQDYLFLALAAVPFITGYLAYHQSMIDYKIMISLHMLFGEIMLMAIPFTKFVHMIYLVIVRFSVISEYGLGKGKGHKAW